MVVELWETLKESITAYTGLSPATFFTVLALGITLYYLVSSLFVSPDDSSLRQRSRDVGEQLEPLPPPVNVGEITPEELKQYDGSDPKKPLLMAIKGQIYDVSRSRMFYGPGGPYALFAGKDASRALAKMSFEDKDLTGDITGLGIFELEALQDWEYKFMSKYVKVGTVKSTVPVTDAPQNPTDSSESSGAQPEEASESSEVSAAIPREVSETTETEAANPSEVSEIDDPKIPEAAENGVAKPAEVSENSDAVKHTENGHSESKEVKLATEGKE